MKLGVNSIYGAKTGKGFVELHVGGETLLLSPAEARDFAANILAAAEAAETDEFLMNFFYERIGLDRENGAVTVLAEFRAWRDQQRKP